MSTYTIKKTQAGAYLSCDGAPFEPAVMLQYTKPMFDYGSHSDSALNLAYAILHHFEGEVVAQALCQDFIGRFLLKSEPQIDISDKQIRDFINTTLDTQQRMENIIKHSKKS
ncbi:MAG: DUF6166 domain-containing protein [Lawsonibacter sp.]|jgi:hypothetical protein